MTARRHRDAVRLAPSVTCRKSLAVVHNGNHLDFRFINEAVDSVVRQPRDCQFACVGDPADPTYPWEMLKHGDRLQYTQDNPPSGFDAIQ